MASKLIMFRSDGSRRDFALEANVTTIGRKEDCDIRIPLPSVSRRHAEILLEDGDLVLRDLGAANGTYLNDRRITEQELDAGDRITIGPVVFTLQIDGDPDDDDILPIPSPGPAEVGGDVKTITASRHMSMVDPDDDPIAALEALASSADQTAVNLEEDEDK